MSSDDFHSEIRMTRLLTRHIASMTEMREPHKVIEKSTGEPVAVLKNSTLVGYFVPAQAISDESDRIASMEEIKKSMLSRREITEPVLDCLKDK
jgi:antitoxin StbD